MRTDTVEPASGAARNAAASLPTELPLRAVAILFVVGAVSLTLLDSIHVHTRTLAYVHPLVYGSAWWVPLLMGCAVAGGGLAYVAGWSRLGGPDRLPTNGALARGALLFAVLYAASGLLPFDTVTKLVLITLGAVVIYRDVDGTRAGAWLLLVGAIAGPIAEAVNPGFRYEDPDVLGVPIWLPSLYACAAPVVGQLARRLLRPTSRVGQLA